jgi:hypothetical protein
MQARAEWATDKQAALGDAFGGLLIEYVAYSTAVQGLPACEHIVTGEKLNSIMADHDTLMSPAQVSSIFGVYENDLQINGYSILQMLTEAAAAYENGDFEQHGYLLGRIMQLVKLPKPTMKSNETALTANSKGDMSDAAEMVQGFLSGVGIVGSHYQDILICIYEADQAALELYADLQIWQEAWEDKSLFEGLFAVVFGVAFVQAVKGQVEPACQNAFGKVDMTPMDKITAIVEDPMAHLNVVGGDIVLNGQPITEGITAAFTAYKNDDMFAFGENIGAALTGASLKYIM